MVDMLFCVISRYADGTTSGWCAKSAAELPAHDAVPWETLDMVCVTE